MVHFLENGCGDMLMSMTVIEKDHLRQVWQDEEVLGEGCAKGERDLHVGLWKDIIGE